MIHVLKMTTAKKRIYGLITAVVFAMTLLPLSGLFDRAGAAAAGTKETSVTFDLKGQGTADEPYKILTEEDLKAMRDAVNSGKATDNEYAKAYYVLEDDIELTAAWQPIGKDPNSSVGNTANFYFAGTFDGKGHKISGLTTTGNGGRTYTLGLFGMNQGTIKNLSVDGNITNGGFTSGILTAMNGEKGTIENCYVSGNVSGSFSIGGIAGDNNGTIKNCYSAVNGSAGSTTFGYIVGANKEKATVSNCYYDADVCTHNPKHTAFGGSSDGDKATGLTKEQLKEGIAAYELRHAQEGDLTAYWGQDLETEETPSLKAADDDRVYKVSYIYNNKELAAAYVNGGDTLELPEIDYDDNGLTADSKWYKDDAHKEAWNFAEDTVKDDMQLYTGDVLAEYTITLDLQGGSLTADGWTVADGKATKTYTKEDEDIALPSPTLANHEFLGWTSADMTEADKNAAVKHGSIGDKTFTAVYRNTVGPVITVKLDEHEWNGLHTADVFDIYFNTPKSVEVSAKDDKSEVVSLSYYISDAAMTEAELKAHSTWTKYTTPVAIDSEGNKIVYVKAVDGDNNASYASTAGIVYDITKPEILGIEEGKTYCTHIDINVVEKNLDKVTAGDDVLYDSSKGGDSQKFTVENTSGKTSEVTLTVTDKAGNTATKTVTLAGKHIYEKPFNRRTEMIIPNTCTIPGVGYLITICDVCGEQTKQDYVGKATGHNWSNWKDIETGACGGKTQQRVCSTCHIVETQSIDSKHTWSDEYTIDKQPSCIVQGQKSIHCTVCDAIKPDSAVVLEPTPHTVGRTVKQNEIPATCTEKGSYTLVSICSVCDCEFGRVVVYTDPLDHEWGDWVKVPWNDDPNSEDGEMQRECSRCGAKDTTEYHDDHQWEEQATVDKEPTCTTAGSKSVHCKNCKATKPGSTETIPATGHKEATRTTESKAATCTEGGYTTVETYCTVCEAVISKVTNRTAQKGHSYGIWEEILSSDGKSNQQRQCLVCGYTEVRGTDLENHKWNTEATIDVEPTCTDDGSKSIHCSVCGLTKPGSSETIAAKGHTWGEWKDISSPDCDDEGTQERECSVCGTKETNNLSASGHTWNEDYTIDREATCTTDGSRSIHCTKCDAIKDSEVIPAKGHTWGEWKDISSPDCDDEGTRERECSVCHTKQTEGLAASGHTWNEDYTVDKEATCTTDGSRSIHCTKCDAVKDSEVIPAKGHDFGEWEEVVSQSTGEVNEERKCKVCGVTETRGTDLENHKWNTEYTIDVEPTCTTEGSKSIHCSVCGLTKPGSSETIAAKGHTWGEWKDISSPDCDDEGTQERECSVCGTKETNNLSASGHTWNEDYTIDREATCTTDGSRSIHCSKCDAVKDSEVIPAKGHDFGEWEEVVSQSTGEVNEERKCKVCGFTETRGMDLENHKWNTEYTIDVEPTCTTEGSKSIHCSVCGLTKPGSSETIAAKGHTWGEWKDISSPDCDDEGTQERECSVCGTKETNNLSASGHTWNEDYTIDREATCTTDGSRSIHCTKCDAIKDSEVIPAKGHTWGEWKDISSPDCDDEGTRERECSVCHTKQTEGLAASGHTWNEDYTVDKEATCTTDGSRSIHCTKCDAVKDSEVIPAKGHDFGEWEEVVSQSTGEVNEERKCKVCGVTETRGTDLENHKWNTEYTIDVEPTCTTEGSRSIHCSVCGLTKPGSSETIAAKGHTWGEWKTISSPDCDDEGTRERECSVCHTKQTEGLAASGHTWNEDYTVDKEATCTTDGSRSIHCTKCDAVKDSEVIPAKGHDFGEWEEVVSQSTGEVNEERKCKVCGFTETRGMDLENHKWNTEYTIDVEPTCTTEGSRSIHCSVCGFTKDSEVIPALGHTWGEWKDISSPDCDDEGTQERECSVCGLKETNGLAANGHAWEDDYTVDKEATCLVDGSESIHCSNCDAVKDSRVIPAPGHHTPAAERQGAKEATPDEDGYTGDVVCEVCGEVIEKGEVIPATMGNIDVVPETGEGAPQLTLTESEKADLEDAALTDEDKEALNNGADIDIILSIEDATETVSDDDKALTDEAVADSYTVGQFINIDITKIIDGAEYAVTQLGKEISLTIAVPDDLKADGRMYAIVRIHDGEADILSDLDSDDDTITFKTDKFSVYAIVYAEKADEPTPPEITEPTEPGDNEPDNNESDISKPDDSKSDDSNSDVNTPDNGKPDNSGSDVSKPDGSLNDNSPATGGDFSLVFMILAAAVLGAICVIRKINKTH